MNPFTVIWIEEASGIWWQFSECLAYDGEHAEEQCIDAYPDGEVLWVNEGHGPASQTMD